MKKEIIKRSVLGMFIGLTISNIVTIIISLIVNNGTYYAIAPELIMDCGNELNAVIFQTF